MTMTAHEFESETSIGIARSSARHSLTALLMGALRGIGNAIFVSRERQAEREIARHLMGSGGRLTDDIERRMMHHLTSGNFSPRR